MLPVAGLFLLLDVVFVGANLHKISGGGWFPLLVGVASLTLMLTWRRGRAVAFARQDENAVTLQSFIAGLDQPKAPVRRHGTAIYLAKQTDTVPAALALNVKHNGVVHEAVLLLQITTSRAPRVAEADRIKVEPLSAGFRRVEMQFGFAEKPDVSAALALHREEVGCDPATASFFLGREDPVLRIPVIAIGWSAGLFNAAR